MLPCSSRSVATCERVAPPLTDLPSSPTMDWIVTDDAWVDYPAAHGEAAAGEDVDKDLVAADDQDEDEADMHFDRAVKRREGGAEGAGEDGAASGAPVAAASHDKAVQTAREEVGRINKLRDDDGFKSPSDKKKKRQK